MTTPFGPVLIGETEKTLGTLLAHFLDGTGLDEREWVTLRLADLHANEIAATTDLVALAADRVHFADATALVDDLTGRSLLADGHLTDAARELVGGIGATIASTVGPIWADLPADDTAAAARVLGEVRDRARAALAAL